VYCKVNIVKLRYLRMMTNLRRRNISAVDDVFVLFGSYRIDNDLNIV
jgi:hypothetical protein